MIGTSLDGLDVALVRFDRGAARPEFLGGATSPLRHSDAERLRAIASGEATHADELGALRVALALDHVEAVESALSAANFSRQELCFVAAHGVTLSHRPRERLAHSWQLLDAEALAARLGCIVLADFRSADVALGGEGASLAPIADLRLRHSSQQDRAILNLGGIMNVSLLPADLRRGVIACDIGPANLPLDWLWRAAGESSRCDFDGERAARGAADARLCAELLAEPWVRASAPRSFGREQFGAEWSARVQQRLPRLEDRLRSVIEVEAQALAIFLAELAGDWRSRPKQPFELYLTGGGRRNATLARRIAEVLPRAKVQAIEAMGEDGDLKEAVDFALLGWMRLCHEQAAPPLARAVLGSLHLSRP
jgi:anhydro-N-acetylmuramic acid kinase